MRVLRADEMQEFGRQIPERRAAETPRRLVACTTPIGTSVRAKRRWILGVGDEEMLRHCEEPTTTKTMPFRPNPLGRWGLPAISSLRAVVDARTSTSVSRLDLAGKTHRRWSRLGWYRSLGRQARVPQAYKKIRRGFRSAPDNAYADGFAARTVC